MSLDPAPWPADVTSRVAASSTVQVIIRARLVGMSSSVDVAVESLDIVEDASRRPFGICTAVLAGRPFDVPGFNPDGFATGATWLHVFAHYAGDPVATDAQRIFSGPILSVTDTGHGYRVEAHTLDALLGYMYTGQGQVPDTANSAAEAMRGLLIQPRTLPFYDDAARPPIPDASTVSQIREHWLNPFDNLADYAAGLVDCYPNAWTYPARYGDRIQVAERVDALAVGTAGALDLRPGAGLLVAPPTVDYSPDDWGNVLRFTATWLDDVTGEPGEHVRWCSELTGIPPNYRERILIQSVDVRRNWRPPGDDLYASPVPVRVFHRIVARTWRATVQAKPLVWLRPGTPAWLGGDLLGVVQSVRFTFPASLMSVTVRPS